MLGKEEIYRRDEGERNSSHSPINSVGTCAEPARNLREPARNLRRLSRKPRKPARCQQPAQVIIICHILNDIDGVQVDVRRDAGQSFCFGGERYVHLPQYSLIARIRTRRVEGKEVRREVEEQ